MAINELRRVARRAAVLVVVCGTGAAFGQTTYSTENGGPSGLDGDDVRETDGSSTSSAGGGGGTGTGMPGDDNDSMSTPAEEEDITICFSVDPFSLGLGSRMPIPNINVRHQAVRRQQAGDAFISTEAWNINTGMIPGAGLGQLDNVLVQNQGRGYSTPIGFGLEPDVGPGVAVPSGTPLDNVDGLTGPTDRTRPELFFTLSNGSESLLTLPGSPTLDRGADIFFDPDITMGGNEQLFANTIQLGLLPTDDIDGLVVYDRDGTRQFSAGDLVFFSLAPESPTLDVFGGSAADVFVTNGLQVRIFVQHWELGLQFGDNIDALHFDTLINGSVEDTILMKVPAPGSLALLGLGGLAAGRRRRIG
ncbi:MAG: PEP-CTERM sorting domain-containing protein [Phycisphaerales bacterium JB037]